VCSRGDTEFEQAPDELQALADDLGAAVIRSGVPAPAIRKVLGMK